jgi:hypothetical protein
VVDQQTQLDNREKKQLALLLNFEKKAAANQQSATLTYLDGTIIFMFIQAPTTTLGVTILGEI